MATFDYEKLSITEQLLETKVKIYTGDMYVSGGRISFLNAAMNVNSTKDREYHAIHLAEHFLTADASAQWSRSATHISFITKGFSLDPNANNSLDDIMHMEALQAGTVNHHFKNSIRPKVGYNADWFYIIRSKRAQQLIDVIEKDNMQPSPRSQGHDKVLAGMAKNARKEWKLYQKIIDAMVLLYCPKIVHENDQNETDLFKTRGSAFNKMQLFFYAQILYANNPTDPLLQKMVGNKTWNTVIEMVKWFAYNAGYTEQLKEQYCCTQLVAQFLHDCFHLQQQIYDFHGCMLDEEQSIFYKSFQNTGIDGIIDAICTDPYAYVHKTLPPDQFIAFQQWIPPVPVPIDHPLLSTKHCLTNDIENRNFENPGDPDDLEDVSSQDSFPHPILSPTNKKKGNIFSGYQQAINSYGAAAPSSFAISPTNPNPPYAAIATKQVGFDGYQLGSRGGSSVDTNDSQLVVSHFDPSPFPSPTAGAHPGTVFTFDANNNTTNNLSTNLPQFPENYIHNLSMQRVPSYFEKQSSFGGSSYAVSLGQGTFLSFNQVSDRFHRSKLMIEYIKRHDLSYMDPERMKLDQLTELASFIKAVKKMIKSDPIAIKILQSRTIQDLIHDPTGGYELAKVACKVIEHKQLKVTKNQLSVLPIITETQIAPAAPAFSPPVVSSTIITTQSPQHSIPQTPSNFSTASTLPVAASNISIPVPGSATPISTAQSSNTSARSRSMSILASLRVDLTVLEPYIPLNHLNRYATEQSAVSTHTFITSSSGEISPGISLATLTSTKFNQNCDDNDDSLTHLARGNKDNTNFLSSHQLHLSKNTNRFQHNFVTGNTDSLRTSCQLAALFPAIPESPMNQSRRFITTDISNSSTTPHNSNGIPPVNNTTATLPPLYPHHNIFQRNPHSGLPTIPSGKFQHFYEPLPNEVENTAINFSIVDQQSSPINQTPRGTATSSSLRVSTHVSPNTSQQYSGHSRQPSDGQLSLIQSPKHSTHSPNAYRTTSPQSPQSPPDRPKSPLPKLTMTFSEAPVPSNSQKSLGRSPLVFDTSSPAPSSHRVLNPLPTSTHQHQFTYTFEKNAIGSGSNGRSTFNNGSTSITETLPIPELHNNRSADLSLPQGSSQNNSHIASPLLKPSINAYASLPLPSPANASTCFTNSTTDTTQTLAITQELGENVNNGQKLNHPDSRTSGSSFLSAMTFSSELQSESTNQSQPTNQVAPPLPAQSMGRESFYFDLPNIPHNLSQSPLHKGRKGVSFPAHQTPQHPGTNNRTSDNESNNSINSINHYGYAGYSEYHRELNAHANDLRDSCNSLMIIHPDLVSNNSSLHTNSFERYSGNPHYESQFMMGSNNTEKSNVDTKQNIQPQHHQQQVVQALPMPVEEQPVSYSWIPPVFGWMNDIYELYEFKKRVDSGSLNIVGILREFGLLEDLAATYRRDIVDHAAYLTKKYNLSTPLLPTDPNVLFTVKRKLGFPVRPRVDDKHCAKCGTNVFGFINPSDFRYRLIPTHVLVFSNHPEDIHAKCHYQLPYTSIEDIAQIDRNKCREHEARFKAAKRGVTRQPLRSPQRSMDSSLHSTTITTTLSSSSNISRIHVPGQRGNDSEDSFERLVGQTHSSTTLSTSSLTSLKSHNYDIPPQSRLHNGIETQFENEGSSSYHELVADDIRPSGTPVYSARATALTLSQMQKRSALNATQPYLTNFDNHDEDFVASASPTLSFSQFATPKLPPLYLNNSNTSNVSSPLPRTLSVVLPDEFDH